MKIALIVLAVLVLAAAAFAVVSIGPRNIVGMMLYDQRREGDLVVGARAPDVALVKLDGRTTTNLSESFGGRPLVLIFGSYT